LSPFQRPQNTWPWMTLNDLESPFCVKFCFAPVCFENVFVLLKLQWMSSVNSKPKRTAVALRVFLATARLSCMYSNNVLISSCVIIPASMAAVVSLELRQAMYDPEQSCTTDVLKNVILLLLLLPLLQLLLPGAVLYHWSTSNCCEEENEATLRISLQWTTWVPRVQLWRDDWRLQSVQTQGSVLCSYIQLFQIQGKIGSHCWCLEKMTSRVYLIRMQHVCCVCDYETVQKVAFSAIF